MKGNSRQGKPREFENFGKHREFKFYDRNLKSRKYACMKDSMKNCCVTSMVIFLMFKMLSFYFQNTQGKPKLDREIAGKTQGILLSKMSGNHGFALRKSVIFVTCTF